MRSSSAWILAAALLLGGGSAGAQAPAAALSASAVMHAASAVQADPLLGGTEKHQVLRFKSKDKKPDSDEVNWWINLIKNLSIGLRVALWVVLAGLFVFVLLRLRDWLRRRGGPPSLAPLAPTHVGTLDIRPASLPDDIGAAAQGLLARGDVRAALSLLYRGALSRLVHTHGVPIRAASTERECLRLAAARLAPGPQDFLTRLVGAWQAVAYAHRQPPAHELLPLCEAFDSALPVDAGQPGRGAA